MLGPSPRFQHHTSNPRRQGPNPDPKSNLERFLDSTAPSVPLHSPFSKVEADDEQGTYFVLGDLWELYKECSVYGKGVPLVLHEKEKVVQYYVPYLSGIQLYWEYRRRPGSATARMSGEESDIDSSRDSSSDSSSDSDLERGMNGLSLKKRGAMSDGFSSDESDAGCNLGHLLFEFFERDAPYSRVPLADKISSLACHFPGLKTLRSCELSPSSWMSVAWYPIYRIPTGPTLRDLDACFLTYHSLSTPPGGTRSIPSSISTRFCGSDENDGFPNVALPILALASYKFKTSIWTPRGDSQRQLISSLRQSADNWLRLLRVNHPDYQFFISRGTFHR